MTGNSPTLRVSIGGRTHRVATLLGATCAAVMAFALTAPARADDVDLHRLFSGPERCDHVIGLLMRYGVNNDSSANANHPGFHPLGPVSIPTTELGDLQLASIVRHEIATGCGPSFDLVLKNCSARDVCGARVTLVGLLGRIHPTCPNVTAKIESLPAGQEVQITMTLPIESLAMGNLNGQTLGMNRVLAVVDSFDQFMESDEANNLRLFELTAIPLAVAATVDVATESAAVQSDTVQSGTVQSAPAQPADSGPLTQPAQPADGGAAATQSPAAPDSAGVTENDLRSAINQFSADATTQQEAL